VADATGAYELVVGVLVTLGTFLLGAWVWAMATHTSPEPRDPPNDEDAP
jgi:hypothetical protein